MGHSGFLGRPSLTWHNDLSFACKKGAGGPRKPGLAGSTPKDGSDGYVSFAQAAEKEGSAIINVAHPLSGWDTRVVAMDRDDQEHVSTRQASGNGPLKQQTVNFSHLPLAQVKEFRFQVRPYRWVEFHNVSLQPGEQTQVEIVDTGNK